MRIEKTTTGLIIHQPTDEVKRKVLQYFSLQNPVREYFIYSGSDTSKKPLFGKEHDVIYISSGFIALEDKVIKKLPSPDIITPPVPKKVDISMNRQPRSKLQEDCIAKMIDPNSKDSKLTIELKPGVGKTFISLYAISKLGYKPLIIAPTTLLKNQWVENFEDLGIDKSDIATHISDAPNKTFCVVTISAIENELRKDWKNLMDTINRSSFGIRVIDEAHLHLKGILKLDAICNIKHNWYLSATLGRSDVSEDRILNRALKDADRFIGNATYDEYKKEYINIYLQDIYYNPSNRLCQDTLKYGTKGLIKASYYKMLMLYNRGVPLINNIINIIKRARGLCDYGSMVVIIPLLSMIDLIKDAMNKDPYFSKYSIGSIDGSMSLSARREVLNGDIIMSTTQSIGTGVDIPGLAILVNFDAFKSPIQLEQVIGRNRLRKDDKDCFYVDTVDHVKQARAIENRGKSRQMIMPYLPGVKPDLKKFPPIKS